MIVLPENLEVGVTYRIRSNNVPNGHADHLGKFTHLENNPLYGVFAHFSDLNRPFLPNQRHLLGNGRYPVALYTFYKKYNDVTLQRVIEGKTGKSIIPTQGFGGKSKRRRKKKRTLKRYF